MNLDDDSAACPCGSGWFRIVPIDDEELEAVAVCLSSSGVITGHTGKLECYECGSEWISDPDARRIHHLRLVE